MGWCSSLAALDILAPRLAALDLRGCGRLRALQLACPELDALNATFCAELGDAALAAAVSARPALRSLVLSACREVGDARATLARLPGLQALDLSYTLVADLSHVISSCTGLRSLSVASCHGLGARALRALIAPGGAGLALPRLEELDASYTEVDAATVGALLGPGSPLRALSLNGCAGVTPALWRHLAAPCAAPLPLQSLSLVKCGGLTSFCAGLSPDRPIVPRRAGWRWGGAAGAAGSPGAQQEQPRERPQEQEGYAWAEAPTLLGGLRSLKLGLSGVQVLALALPALVSLDVTRAVSLTTLQLRCPALTSLQAHACAGLPPAQLTGAAAGCPALTSLDAQHVALAPEDAAALRARGVSHLLLCPGREACEVCRIGGV
jgi:hypothetical protein